MSTLFVWTGKGGPDWDSTSGTITNWVITPGGTNTIVPSSGTTLEAVADFNDGGIHSVGGNGDADQFSITDNTTVTLQSGHFRAGDLDAANNADFPDDLVVDNGSKLIIASDGALANSGSVSVIGLGNDLFGAPGASTLEVDSGGGFSAEALIIGDGTAGVGVVTANGAAGFFVVAAPGDSGNGQLTIGYAGTGSLEITNTAAVFTESAVLGLNQGAVGSLSLDSSIWGGGGVTLGAAGTGHMTIGAGASVALADVIVGAAQTGSGDLLVNGASFGVDFLTIGMDGTGTATFGTNSIGQFATVTVGESADAIANLALNGSTWNTGSLTIGLTGTGHATAGAGEVITVNNAVLGSGADASGDLTLDGAALNGGTVAIGHDGTGDLAIGSGSSGSVAVVVVGEDAGSRGTLTIDGADWNVGSLTVGLTGIGQATVGTGATATLDNILIGPNGDLAVTGAAGSVGTVIAQQVSIDFGVLDLSQGGQVLIGAATGTDGAVAIGSKSSLTGLGSLKGDVVLSNGGLVEATAPVPGALKIDGHITGAGTIEPLMTLEANGGIGAGVDIAFSPSAGAQVGDLVLDVPTANLGTITGFGIGNTIDIRGSLYTDAVFTQGTSGAAGTLMLSGGTSAPLSLAVAGTYTTDNFVATPGTTDAIVTLGTAPRKLLWTGANSDNFGDPGNWNDTGSNSPAGSAPEGQDTAGFAAGDGAISGSGTVATLTFNGNGDWHLGSGVTLTALASVEVGTGSAGSVFVTNGARLADGGMLSVGSGASGILAIALGGSVTAAAMDIGAQAGGAGIVSATGTGSNMTVSGQLTIGDSASAELSILNGATISATNADVGLNATGTGNIDIEGTGSELSLSGDLNLGDAGTGVLTLGNNTTLHAAGNVNIGANGVLNQFGGTVDPSVVNNTGRAGGKGSISASVSIANSGTLFAASGTETLSAPIITGTGALEIDSKGDLAVNVGSVAATQTVSFTDGTGVLTIGTLGGFSATIGDIIAGDSIVVHGTSIAFMIFNASTHVLTLFDPSQAQAGVLQFGTSVVDQSLISVNGLTPCFVAGTRISTERGEVCVEELRVGDLVQVVSTAPSPQPPPARGGGVFNKSKEDPPSPCGRGLGGGGRAHPVIWLGHRTVNCAHHPEPRKVWPVRVAAQAFGPGRPSRDLWLSPDHALYISDVLIPVKHLINGTIIAQVPCDEVTYYHVELPQHAVLLAEGLPAESYLDTGDRSNFANGDAPVALHPDFASRMWEARGCAPVVVAGPELAAARRTLQFTTYAAA